MAFKPHHWRKPRHTIANKYTNNDLGYATHGALVAVDIIKRFDRLPSDLANLTLLDYGCGTGRIGRILSPMFKQVRCFDPTEECIKLAHQEHELCDAKFGHITYYTDLSQVPVCDVGVSVSVIEHLCEADASVMISNLKEKVAGETILWYSTEQNRVLDKYLTEQQLQEDKKIRIQIRSFNLRSAA